MTRHVAMPGHAVPPSSSPVRDRRGRARPRRADAPRRRRRTLARLPPQPRRGDRPRDRRSRSCSRALFADVDRAALAERAVPRRDADAAVAGSRSAATRFLLGTDPVGRDMLSRLIHGTRLSLMIGLVSVGAVAERSASLLGLLAGFFRGGVEFIDHAADGRHAGAAEPAARDRGGRDPRPGPAQRDVRDRDRDAAALRAPDARRGDRRAGQGLRQRVAHRRRRHRCG